MSCVAGDDDSDENVDEQGLVHGPYADSSGSGAAAATVEVGVEEAADEGEEVAAEESDVREAGVDEEVGVSLVSAGEGTLTGNVRTAGCWWTMMTKHRDTKDASAQSRDRALSLNRMNAPRIGL